MTSAIFLQKGTFLQRFGPLRLTTFATASVCDLACPLIMKIATLLCSSSHPLHFETYFLRRDYSSLPKHYSLVSTSFNSEPI